MISRSFIHRVAAAVVTILTLAAPVGRCLAVDPPSITGLSSRSSLSADERGQIEEYAQAYTAMLLQTADDPSEIRRIRSKLIDVVRRGGTSEIFRDTYSRYTLPGLEKVVDEGRADQAVTALIVASQLGTEQALSALVDRCSVDAEPRRHVRLAAARSAGHLLSLVEPTVVNMNKISAAARDLAADVEREPDPYAIRHMIQAIHAATEATQDVPTRGQMHIELVRAIRKTAERAAAANASEAASLLSAMYPVLHRLRTRFILMDLSMQSDLGRRLGPSVLKVLEVATAHWSELQGYEGGGGLTEPAKVIAVCERFVGTIDRVVRGDRDRPAEEDLKNAWDAGDMKRFNEVLGRWTALLRQAPY